MKYTYSNFFNNYTKGISAFILGALFLGAGEWLSRKAKNIAALGLTGGGIAILYLSIFSSYFILKPRIISLEAGILLSILVTVIALVLSLYYKSKTILSFALIGGYFPFFAFVFSFGLDEKSIYIAMGYLFMLNLLTLLISFYKKWDIVNYISFILNVPTLIYLVFKANNQLFAISYSLLTFAMYLVITLLYPLKLKLKLKVVDIILLGLNTFISCLIIYLLFEKAGFSNFRGLLAVVFCLIYFGIGKFMKITMKEENSTQALFYLTAFAFAILIIPFQFGVSWLSIGWLVEGILLILYGFRFKVKNYEYGGWILFGFCLFAFYFIDVPTRISGYETITTIFKCISIFDFKFFSILAGLLLTMFMYLNSNSDNAILKYSTRGKAVTALKYFTVLNTWAFLLYASVEFYNNIIIKNNIFIDYYEGFYKIVLLVFVTAALAFAITKIKLLYDKAIRGFSIFLYILVDLACIITNMDTPLFGNGDNYLEYLSIGILLIYNVMVFLSIKDLLLLFLKKNELNFEAFPLLISAYLLSSLTAILIVQFNLGGYNLLFSLIYLVAAFVMIIYGFKKKFVLMRRFGLGLSVFSTAKLFIYDLRFLETAGKIVSYFAFGLVLVGISLIYQRFSKSLQRTIDI